MKIVALAVLLLTLSVCKRSFAQSGLPDGWRELLKEALEDVAGLETDTFEEDYSSRKQKDVFVPQFMYDMYDCWNTIDDDNDTNVLQHCQRAILDEEEETLPKVVQEADTMLTFLHEGTADSRKKHPVDARSMKSIGRSASLHFVPKCLTQKPMSAEFRIHKNVTRMEALPQQCRIAIKDKGIIVKLWISDERKGNKTVEFVRHVRTQRIPLLGQPWLLFKGLQNVTSDWFQNINRCEQRKSIYITLGEGCAGVDPALLGFDTSNTPGAQDQPFFSLFISNEEGLDSHPFFGEDHMNITEVNEKRRKQRDLSSEFGKFIQERVRQQIDVQRRNTCQAYDYRVDLSEIGWDDMVVAPPSGFTTKYCLGHCLFPLNTTRDSFHAVIQAISHIHRPDEIPPPCCVPKTFAPLAILMRTDENQLVLRRLERMIVKECACW